MWVQRIGQLVRLHNGPLLIEENLYGVSEIADSLISPDGRVLWIEFSESNLEALRAVAWGVPEVHYLDHLVDALRKHREIVHPSVQPIVILTRVEYAIDEVSRVLADHDTGHHVVVCGAAWAIKSLADSHPGRTLLTLADLRINSVEAKAMLTQRQVDGHWLDLLDDDAIITYDEFSRAAYSRLGLEMPARRTPLGKNNVSACLTKSEDGLISLLSKNRQWNRALDVALATNNPELLAVIDMVAEDALLHDEVDSFRRKLMLLPSSIGTTAEVLYWRLIADCLLDVESDALALAMQSAQKTQCPRLLMLLVALGELDASSIPETIQTEGADPMLVVYKAHLKSFVGSNNESVALLRQMIEMFRAAGRDYRLVQSMTILANSLVLRGQFQEAAHWGLEARQLALELDLREYEVTYVSGPVAYALIVSGEWHSAGEILSSVQNAEKFAGRPYAEGIISTIADYFAVAGHFATALKWYDFIIDKYRGPAANMVMPDVSLMLLRLGRSNEALGLIKARAAESISDDISQKFLELAHSLALLDSNTTGAINGLKAVLGNESPELAAPYRVRAALMIALQAERSGFTESALESLDSVSSVLMEVGETGWQLLSGRDANVLALRTRWLDSRSQLDIEFMVGKGNWSFRDSSSKTVRGNRLKELIFVLSWFPEGVRGEYMQELLGWGELAEHTVRRHMQRLRKYVPIEARPYRLRVSVSADYLCLLQAIDNQDLGKALKLYAGPLLRDSDAPFVREKRASMESQLRALVLKHANAQEMAEFALKVNDDIELLECALAALDKHSLLWSRVEAQISSLKSAWVDN